MRPILGYCSCLWNIGYIGDSRLLESLQKKWTKQVNGLSNLDYGTRLQRLGLFSIRGSLLRSDLIKCWKVFHGYQDVWLFSIFVLAPRVGTREHQSKLSVPACSTELQRRFFTVRSVYAWNSLPAKVVESTFIDAFKRALALALGGQLYYRD